MKHMRVPVSDRSPSSMSYEGAFFGYVYFWATHHGGTVNSRVEWRPNEIHSGSEWTDTMSHEPLPPAFAEKLSFEEDILDILNDAYRGALVQAGTPQVKMGRNWVAPSGLIHIP